MVIKRSQIEEWDVSRLSAYGNNAKLHPDSHVEQIANSIEEFTFLDPVAVDEKGELLEGHGRLLAAKKRGDKTIPVIQVTGLSDAQKVAYRLAHNKLTMNTGFDPEMLKIDFEFLQDEGFDPDLTGFGELELSFLDEGEKESSPGGEHAEITEAGSQATYQNKYAVAIECESESEQEQTYNKLIEMGYTCKVLTL